MSEEIPRVCETCQKDDNRTRKVCPTRMGCFTPHYVNWEPIQEDPITFSGKIESAADIRVYLAKNLTRYERADNDDFFFLVRSEDIDRISQDLFKIINSTTDETK